MTEQVKIYTKEEKIQYCIEQYGPKHPITIATIDSEYESVPTVAQDVFGSMGLWPLSGRSANKVKKLGKNI